MARFGGKVVKNKAILTPQNVFADFRRGEGRWPSSAEAKETAKNISAVLSKKGKNAPPTVVLLTKYPNAPSWVKLGEEWVDHALVLTPSPDAVPVFGRASAKRPAWEVHGLSNAVAYASLAVNHAKKQIVLMELQDAARSQRVSKALERFSVKHNDYEHGLHVLAVSAILLAREMRYSLYAVTPNHVKRVWPNLNPKTAEGVYGGVVSSACRSMNLPETEAVEAVKTIGERASALRDSRLRRVYSHWVGEKTGKPAKVKRRRLTPEQEEKMVRRTLELRKVREKAFAEDLRRRRELLNQTVEKMIKRARELEKQPSVLPGSRKQIERVKASKAALLRERLKRAKKRRFKTKNRFA